ncbi:hypothetical protein [Embleya sp. MST-111070]|uniref:hypothetical protein n=1 Tax=Embleya sp. MST-111070 TaxID=3398231 RepID=UPI003F73DABB
MVSKKDAVPPYVPTEPSSGGPSRNALLDRYNLGTQVESEAAPLNSEADAEQEMREWEAEQARRLAAPEQATPTRAQGTQVPATRTASDIEVAEDHDSFGVTRLPTHADEHGYVAIPRFTPPTSEVPSERLEQYLQGIGQVEYAAKSNEQRVQQQRLLTLGQYILGMKEERIWEAGGYETLGDLLLENFGIRKDYANKVVRALPVIRALEDVTTVDLKERQLRVLVPVHAVHGDEGVRKVWDEASRRGKFTQRTLEQAVSFLGYGPPTPITTAAAKRELEAPVNAGTEPARPAAGEGEVQTRVFAPRIVEVCTSIRELRTTNEEQAMLELKEIWAAVDGLRRELGVDFDPEAL